ncbi:MAG TPA: hypothetical protein VGD78_15700 [Chthoniobacterales bacterium]
MTNDPTSFQVRSSSGTEQTYHFDIPPSQSTATQISQQQATLAALFWAKGFYNANKLTLDSIQFETAPNPHYLAHLSGDLGGGRQPLYAAVLPDGKIVRPSSGPAMMEHTGKMPMKKGHKAKMDHSTM